MTATALIGIDVKVVFDYQSINLVVLSVFAVNLFIGPMYPIFNRS